MKYILNLFCIFFLQISIAQQTDTLQAVGTITQDTYHIDIENPIKNKFWGNNYFIGGSYQLSRTHELQVNLGRSFVRVFSSGGGSIIKMNSWGVGYSVFKRNENEGQTVNAFYEHSLLYFPPISYTLRGDYIYDWKNDTHYFRPSVGLNLFFLDLLYNYSFKLKGERNNFKHGFVIRYKHYFPSDKWQKRSPKF